MLMFHLQGFRLLLPTKRKLSGKIFLLSCCGAAVVFLEILVKDKWESSLDAE
jgi:hypothetical protein